MHLVSLRPCRMVCSSHILFNEENFAGVLIKVDSMAQSTGKVYPTEVVYLQGVHWKYKRSLVMLHNGENSNSNLY